MYTDPLGLYEYAASVKDEKQKEKFEAALKAAQDNLKKIEEKYGKDSKQYQKAEKAISAYGKPGEKNGVIVSFDRKGSGGFTTATKSGGKVTQINVQFNAKELESGSFQALVGHEGSHVNYFQTEKGFDRYDYEFRGHEVQSLLAEAQYPDGSYHVSSSGNAQKPSRQFDLWNSEWDGPNREERRTNAKYLSKTFAV